MSSLLKKCLEPEVADFGFPMIENGRIVTGEERHAPPDEEGQMLPPEINHEELFRQKLLELERRTQEIEKEAYGKGFAQGEKDGFEYGQKAVQVVKSQLERLAGSMDALPGKVLQDYRSWLIQSSLKIAKHIVKREVRISPEIVAGTVNALLQEADEHTTLTVYVSPQDMEFMEKRAELTLAANRKHFTLKADKELERGSCRVESAVQLIDASIESQFENLEKHLLGGEGLACASDESDGE
ncbi:MAG: FliH/SctL family protein [Syntrophobacteraceae bacterium]